LFLCPQFSDISHFTQLFSSSWPAATISDDASLPGTLTASLWNYGSNFGGPTSSSWTSGADTAHSYTDATGGMFGTFGVDDENYDNIWVADAVAAAADAPN
jgi:hypothetical protein